LASIDSGGNFVQLSDSDGDGIGDQCDPTP